MKRCLLLSGRRIDGDARTVLLARSLARRGAVDLLCPDAGPEDEAFVPGEVTIHSIPGYELRAGGIRGRLRQHRRLDPVVERALSLDRTFDAVFACGLAALSPAALVARRMGAALVYDARGIYLEEHPAGRPRGAFEGFVLRTVLRLARRAGRRFERRLLKEADLVLASHPAVAEWLVANAGAADPVVVRTLPMPSSEAGGDRLRGPLGLSPDDGVVLSSGPMVRERGLDALLRAAAALPEDVHLVFAGSGPLESRLRLLADGPDVAGRVHFAGPVPAVCVPEFATFADLAVQWIRGGGVTEEAELAERIAFLMAAGVPVLAPDLPETRRILAGPEAGWVLSSSDPGGLPDALLRILEDPGEVRRRGENARRFQRENLGWEREDRILKAALAGAL